MRKPIKCRGEKTSRGGLPGAAESLQGGANLETPLLNYVSLKPKHETDQARATK